MNETYKKQVALLIRIMPLVYKIPDFEAARKDLIENTNKNLTDIDRGFLFSFESGSPDWGNCCAGDLSAYPAIQWKLQNIQTLKERNPSKFNEGIEKLRRFLF